MSSPPSAWGHVENMYGNLNTQLSNSLQSSSNGIVPVMSSGYTNSVIPHSYSGGRHKKRRTQRAGSGLLSAVNQALIPFGLFGLQHAYGKRIRRKGKK
jgi:hypothetical protein